MQFKKGVCMKQESSFASETLVVWCGRIASVVVTNLLWILCCLPVVTAGAATKAMYHNLYCLLREEECSARSFFRAFADGFARVTAVWTVILVAGAALLTDYYLVAYMEFPGRMAVIGLIFFVGFLLVFVTGLMFPMLSQFAMSIKDAAINGVLLSLAHLPRVFLVSAMNLLPWALLVVSAKWFLMLSALWLLGGYSLIGLYNAKLLEPVFAPYRDSRA